MTRVEHLAEMTLIDENTQLILTDDSIRKSQAIWQCMWRHLVAKFCTNARIFNKFMWHHLLTKFASYRVLPVMVSTHGSVVPLAMFVDYVRIHLTVLIPLNSIWWNIDLFRKPKYLSHRTTFRICALLKKYYKISIPEWYEEKTQVWDRGTRKIFASKNVFKKMFLDSLESFRTFWKNLRTVLKVSRHLEIF